MSILFPFIGPNGEVGESIIPASMARGLLPVPRKGAFPYFVGSGEFIHVSLQGPSQDVYSLERFRCTLPVPQREFNPLSSSERAVNLDIYIHPEFKSSVASEFRMKTIERFVQERQAWFFSYGKREDNRFQMERWKP